MGRDFQEQRGGFGGPAPRGGRGAPRGGRGGGRGGAGGGFRGAPRVRVEPHRFPGVYIARGQQDALVTKNLTPGETVYGEKKITVKEQNNDKTEYRVWNVYRSKIAAAIVGGVKDIYFGPGSKVLYLGAASGTTVSHVSDIVGPVSSLFFVFLKATRFLVSGQKEGVVYAVEFSLRSGRDLVNMAKKRTNIVPIICDARKPLEYRSFLGMVDLVFADVAQPDQARIIGLNCRYFLKNGGHFMVSIKANCIDSTNPAEVVFKNEVERLREEGLTPRQQMTLEPYERDHVVVVGDYRADSQPTSKKA